MSYEHGTTPWEGRAGENMGVYGRLTIPSRDDHMIPQQSLDSQESF